MKLYEFTYTDNQNISESEILHGLQDFLASEAELQGWANGYNLRQCKEIVQLAGGEKQFTFEVLGEYIDSNGLNFNDEIREEQSLKPVVAAKDISL